jgi:hypothetical protein
VHRSFTTAKSIQGTNSEKLAWHPEEEKGVGKLEEEPSAMVWESSLATIVKPFFFLGGLIGFQGFLFNLSGMWKKKNEENNRRKISLLDRRPVDYSN